MTSRRALLAVPAAALLLVGAAAVPAAAAPSEVTLTGHGWGHGRGMGQFGALGYAVDQGWSHGQILGHYYGGTTAGTAGNPPISVELLAWRDKGAIATAPGLTVNGALTGSGAVLVERTAGGFLVKTGPGCAGPWTPRATYGSGLVLGSVDGPEIEVCESTQIRGYRGDLQLVERGAGSALVNRVASETYLRGVVPRESSPSWATLGGGRGAAALRAQAVAARSYMLAAPYAAYATTCDTQSCQVYGGAWTRPFTSSTRTSLDDPRTDAAIAATVGEVRRHSSGAVARTEFSSSTGGWTAGGVFPAVEDRGDAVAGNPNHDWLVRLSWADLEARLGVGPLRGFSVTRRNGLGADGGRVLEAVADTASGQVVLSGNTVRQRLGLKSDWFSVSTLSYSEAQALVRASWIDLLERPPSSAELDARVLELASGRPLPDFARETASSAERAAHLVEETYLAAHGRYPSPEEREGWGRVFSRTGSMVELRTGVFGSYESWLRSGSDDQQWVARLYRGVLNREASAEERAGYAAAARSRGREAVAREVASSSEARVRRLERYYGLLLGRAPDPGSAGYLEELRGAGDVTVPTGIASSPEYRQRARARFPG